MCPPRLSTNQNAGWCWVMFRRASAATRQRRVPHLRPASEDEDVRRECIAGSGGIGFSLWLQCWVGRVVFGTGEILANPCVYIVVLCCVVIRLWLCKCSIAELKKCLVNKCDKYYGFGLWRLNIWASVSIWMYRARESSWSTLELPSPNSVKVSSLHIPPCCLKA